MLIKLTEITGGVLYIDAYLVDEISSTTSNGRPCTRVRGHYVQEPAEKIAQAVNAARLLDPRQVQVSKDKVMAEVANDPGLAGMIPMALLFGISLGAMG